jgi:hypothetical protein
MAIPLDQLRPDQLRLGYLLMSMPLPNTYVGGLMVTDYRGLPVAFQYTEPIQPNSIQQILYGQVLSRYIKQEVIFDTLMGSLQEELHCLLVSDDQLLGATLSAKTVSKPGSKIKALPPIVRISEPSSANRLNSAGAVSLQAPGDCLLQPTAEANPVRLQWAVTTTNEGGKEAVALLPSNSSVSGGGASDNNALPPVINDVLLLACGTMDLVEPLRRIEKALESICAEAGIKG